MMKIRAVGDNVKNFITTLYNNCLNKIAIHSQAYKSLYNEYYSNMEIHRMVTETHNELSGYKTLGVLRMLYQSVGVHSISEYDIYAIRQSTVDSVFICSDSMEKLKILQEIEQVSGVGQVFTIDEIIYALPNLRTNSKFFICSSLWIKDLTNIMNLLFKMELIRKGTHHDSN